MHYLSSALDVLSGAYPDSPVDIFSTPESSPHIDTQWRIIPNGDGSHRLMSVASGRQCGLCILYATTADGGLCIQYYYNGSQNDEWYFEPMVYEKFSRALSAPTTPTYVTNALNTINAEYNVWPAASKSKYYNETDSDRRKFLMHGWMANGQYTYYPTYLVASALTTVLGAIGDDDAKELYNYYLGNTGTARTINFKEMITEDSNARNIRVTDVNEALVAAERLAVSVGQSVTFCSTVASEKVNPNLNRNWKVAINSYSTKIKCTVTKTSANSYSAQIRYYLYDVFDWDRTKTADFTQNYPALNIPISSTLSQQDMWELQYAGYAKGFKVTGENVLQVTWNAGQRMNNGVTITSDT